MWKPACWFGLFLLGCAAARGPTGQLADAANELNLATRFGRMEMAMEHTAPDARASFIERRQHWGNDLRVVDVNVTSIVLRDDESADVLVQVAWTRMDEGTLRATAVKQRWENPSMTGWRLERERRIAGDAGLFGEVVREAVRETPRDVHFQSKSLGTVE